MSTKWRTLLLTLLLALVHGALVFASFGGSPDLFQDRPSTPLESACEWLAAVLVEPVLLVWNALDLHAANAPEWAGFAANSLLWGAAGALAAELVIRRRRRASIIGAP